MAHMALLSPVRARAGPNPILSGYVPSFVPQNTGILNNWLVPQNQIAPYTSLAGNFGYLSVGMQQQPYTTTTTYKATQQTTATTQQYAFPQQYALPQQQQATFVSQVPTFLPQQAGFYQTPAQPYLSITSPQRSLFALPPALSVNRPGLLLSPRAEAATLLSPGRRLLMPPQAGGVRLITSPARSFIPPPQPVVVPQPLPVVPMSPGPARYLTAPLSPAPVLLRSPGPSVAYPPMQPLQSTAMPPQNYQTQPPPQYQQSQYDTNPQPYPPQNQYSSYQPQYQSPNRLPPPPPPIYDPLPDRLGEATRDEDIALC